MTATAETFELDSEDGPGLKTGGTTNLTTGARSSQPSALTIRSMRWRADADGRPPFAESCGTMSPLTPMAPKRAAAYIALALVLAAWFASASGISTRSTPEVEQPPPVPTAGTATLAADVQAQAKRLRDRMESPPSPQQPLRNPFEFAPREPRRQRAASSTAPSLVPPGSAAIPEPPLTLVGVAEQQTPAGVVRTAMITADSDELFMLAEGDVLGGRYRVKTVASDSAELTDLVSGSIRLLSLR